MGPTETRTIAAGKVTRLNQDSVACIFDSIIRSLSRRRVQFEHERCHSVYGEGVNWDLERGWEREEAMSLAKLRSGHSLELGGYRRRNGLEGSGLCRRCGEDIVESVEHVMSHVDGAQKRLELGLPDVRVVCSLL